MAEADKIATRSVRMAAVINYDGTLSDCPYCKSGLSVEAEAAAKGKLIIQCLSETGCFAKWTAVPTIVEDLLDNLNIDRVDLNRVPFIKLILNPVPYNRLLEVYVKQNEWTKQYMELKGWEWLCVCGGKVVAGSSSLHRDFPSFEKKLEISMNNDGFVPICISGVQPISE